MRLLVDMNLAPGWVPFLSAAGFDAVHWSSVGAPDAADSVIIEYARLHDQCLLTQDLDFGAILAHTNWQRPSLVQIRAGDLSPQAIGEIVIRALRQCRAEIGDGALMTIEPERVRVRVLPLGA
ncbi:MAG: DUF5615 family PIN-like protein [Hyphomicrobiales bacterium]|nr:DUF5615 family PIN-like protein [Hyphomicrobiales bacterium]